MFFGNVRETCRTKILKVMSFIEGKLSVRYLGIPLLSKRLYVNDCYVSVDKVKKRILNWKNKLMSFVGRLQLILSVVGSMKKWPRGLSMEFNGLNAIEPLCLTEGKKDKVLWKTVSGRLKDFFVNTIWNDLRVCSDTVPWAKLVWFSQCIPRHAFMVRLAIYGRLKTQDLMGIREKNDDMRCVFYKNVPDSHDHLFFE
nr:hypothetical protein [Tanacetum cinerariifolium]